MENIEKIEKLKEIKNKQLLMDHDKTIINHFIMHVNANRIIQEDEERLIK